MKKVKAYGEILELPDYRIHWLSKVVYSSPFELIIAFVILVNAVSLGLLTMPGVEGSTRSAFETLDNFALYIYSTELVLRMISYGKKPWECCDYFDYSVLFEYSDFYQKFEFSLYL